MDNKQIFMCILCFCLGLFLYKYLTYTKESFHMGRPEGVGRQEVRKYSHFHLDDNGRELLQADGEEMATFVARLRAASADSAYCLYDKNLKLPKNGSGCPAALALPQNPTAVLARAQAHQGPPRDDAAPQHHHRHHN